MTNPSVNKQTVQKRKRGRPPGSKSKTTLEIEAAVRAHAGDAIKALVAVATKGKREAARVAAATALLDRGYGRPKQSLEHSGKDGAKLLPSMIAVTLIPPTEETPTDGDGQPADA